MTQPLDLARRPRRLRRTPALRALVRETRLSADQFVLPLFVCEGSNVRRAVTSMPGVFQLSVDETVAEARAALDDGVGAVLLFGLPQAKDETGSAAYDANGPVNTAIRALRTSVPEMLVITDVCLCEYTSHGHCGVVDGEEVQNDPTLELRAQMSVAHAKAGAHVIAPSDMMDGRVGAIRSALDAAGHLDVQIMAYTAKYASAFYGPFRDAVGSSATLTGDKRTYQMDYGNSDEALREAELDIAEGADMIMVKPGLPYLDILGRIKDAFGMPTFAYQVSGEYAMIMAAAQNGWIDGDKAMIETLTAFKRAGADGVLTYFAPRVAEKLKKS
jgi:porphobilinogen synthase